MNMMSAVLLAFFLIPFLRAQSSEPVGNAAAGQKAWAARECGNCHGRQGQGAFGPDLAGRQLTYQQFRQEVRKPWGIMPAFIESQVTDQNLADMRAYFLSLPPVAEPGPWEYPAAPAGAPPRQDLLISYGCAQCHEQELKQPRESLGGIASDVTFELFSKIVYNHSDLYHSGRMGNFSRKVLPEPVLRELFQFLTQDLGLVPTMASAMPPPAPDGANTTYTLFVKNRGIKGKGLTAGDVTISLVMKTGTSIVKTTGIGYQGVQVDPLIKSDAATWKVPSMDPGDLQTFSVTIAGKGGTATEVFNGSSIRWAKPEVRTGIVNLDSLVDGMGRDRVYNSGRVSGRRVQLDREITPGGNWVGGAYPPMVCDDLSSASRGVAGCPADAN